MRGRGPGRSKVKVSSTAGGSASPRGRDSSRCGASSQGKSSQRAPSRGVTSGRQPRWPAQPRCSQDNQGRKSGPTGGRCGLGAADPQGGWVWAAKGLGGNWPSRGGQQGASAGKFYPRGDRARPAFSKGSSGRGAGEGQLEGGGTRSGRRPRESGDTALGARPEGRLSRVSRTWCQNGWEACARMTEGGPLPGPGHEVGGGLPGERD